MKQVGDEAFRAAPSERVIALATLVLSGGAAIIAVLFAMRQKPHVLLHMALAYALLWALLTIYALAHRRQRRLFCLLLWATTVLFCVLICFIHLDDVPDRWVYRAGGEAGPGMIERGSAPLLLWAVGFNAAWIVLFSLHALWLGRKRRPRA